VLLHVGDYSLRGASEQVAIERKRGGELASCCGVDRERFIAQVERLRAYPVRYLVVESTAAEMTAGIYRSNISPLSVMGTCIKIMSDWQIPVLFCGDAADTALWVERILLREAKRIELAAKEAERAERKRQQWEMQRK
jgi:ERCC4-type nuclease